MKRLRDYYFEGVERDWNNEYNCYSTGTAWDLQFNELTYYIVTETFSFFDTFLRSVSQAAEDIPLPAGFFELSIPERVAEFNRRAAVEHMPAEILPGDLICGARFNMKPWAMSLMRKMDTLSFISWVDTDGWPAAAPCIQLQAADAGMLVLTNAPYKAELSAIPAGARVAVFGANLKFESVLLKGTFSGFRRGLATVEIDRVYNGMPPKHGYIFEARAN